MVHLRILAFGASLTEGYYAGGLQFHPYTIRLGQLLRSLFLTVDINNAGVSGEAVLSQTMLPRLKQLLSSSSSAGNNHYDWVLILAGTNDIIRDQEKPSRVFEGYKLLIDECHKHQARVLCMTLPETGYPKGSSDDLQRQEFNRLIRQELISKTNEKDNIVILDVDQFLPYHSLSSNERKQIWDDEVHLKPYGYDRLGQLIYDTLKNYLTP
jgi:lysophospholipase L1-like esterase